jgi:hypothetical protein
MHDYVNNVTTIVKDSKKHSLIPFEKAELGRRNLSIGSRVELRNFERTKDQSGTQTYSISRKNRKRLNKKKWKSKQVGTCM